MTVELSQYLDIIRDNLRLDKASESEVIIELQTHIEDNIEEIFETKYALSEIHALTGNYIKAIEHLQICLKINPNVSQCQSPAQECRGGHHQCGATALYQTGSDH